MAEAGRECSPPGFNNQLYEPRSGAQPFHQVVCCLFNIFQLPDFLPTRTPLDGYFSTVLPTIHHLCYATKDSQIYISPELASIPNLHEVKIQVSTCRMFRTRAHYRLRAAIVCYDRYGQVVHIPAINGYPAYQLHFESKLEWTIPVTRDGVDAMASLDWEDIMRMLRWAGKSCANTHGEPRPRAEILGLARYMDDPFPGFVELRGLLVELNKPGPGVFEQSHSWRVANFVEN